MSKLTAPKSKIPSHQLLPRSGAEREALREKGQFWTPSWVANAMVAYCLRDNPGELLDPAAGEGAFFEAALTLRKRSRKSFHLFGYDLDPEMCRRVTQQYGSRIEMVRRDFVLNPPSRKFAAIVANPPYIRHHRIPAATKASLRRIAKEALGTELDGRAGLHIYFLIRALQMLESNGRLAFILPADVFEGVFSKTLWTWISTKFSVEAIVTFAPDATPFPGVDTNAVVAFVRHSVPSAEYRWVRCRKHGSAQLQAWAGGASDAMPFPDLEIELRQTGESVRCGLARPRSEFPVDGPILFHYAKVVRGIATGDNSFFVLTRAQIAELGIPLDYFKRVVGRTRDAASGRLTEDDLNELDMQARPTYLLAPPDAPWDSYPQSLRDYLESGSRQGLHQRALISSRKPWYKAERREVPPLLFAYLGRRNSRFIRNLSSAVPLTGFLCVYPTVQVTNAAERLWKVLSEGDLTAALVQVGKTYGGGAVKVEPRSLERLPLSKELLQKHGLPIFAQAKQLEIA